MAAKRLPKDPQRVKITPEDRLAFKNWLVNELLEAQSARSSIVDEGGALDTWHGMYEQAPRPRRAKVHWPDAADLASYIPCEKVDALRARLVQIVFGPDPICTVEGWGEPAQRVAKVEAFLQWQADNERLSTFVSKALHMALVEGTGILEVTERAELKKSRVVVKAAMQTDGFGAPMLDENFEPQPIIGDDQKVQPWDGDEQQPHLDLQVDKIEWYGRGPQYRVLSLKDFHFLPGHAKDLSEVWGFAKRCWLREIDLRQRVEAGIYDRGEVETILAGGSGERQTREEHLRMGQSVAAQEGPTAEYELWEVHLFHDIDEDGLPEWLITAVSVQADALPRLAHDDLQQCRFVAFTPLPNPQSVYGYSLIGHKLITIADEHTALRNMKADKQAIALNAPIKRLADSMWDPEIEPIGPSSVIPVRRMDEVEQMQFADVPPSVIDSERGILGAAERVVGASDSAISGVTPTTARTATENNIVAQAAYVRVDEMAKHCQQGVADLYDLRCVLWKRALMQDEGGMVAPESLREGLEARGYNLPTDGPFRITAADLEGSFKFKPRGSVETSDYGKLRGDLSEMMNALKVVMTMFPATAAGLMQNPEAGQEILEQVLRLYRMPNLQVFLRRSPGMAAPQGVGPVAPGLGGGLPPELMAMLGGGGAPPPLMTPQPQPGMPA